MLDMGRRWGKSVLGGCVSLAAASQGAQVAWITPTYKNSRPLWRWAERAVTPLRASKAVDISRAENVIGFPTSGGFLAMYSADSPDSIRGEAFHLAILDEAARIAEDTWTDSIQPTLADYAGDAILISTPKGRNWFWREWLRGSVRMDTEIASWHAPSSANPNPNIQRAARLARDRMPERTYRQEWLAEFVEDGGGVFRNVTAAATARPQAQAIEGHEYVFGVDWGRSNDWSVFAVVDVTTSECVALDRSNRIEYVQQRGRLAAMAERFQPRGLVVEANSMGEPNIEMLQRDGLPVIPFTTTNASKAIVIDALSLAFERGSIRILPDPVLIAELQAYESERLPSGLIRYSAPEGMHDDTVIALALAWHGASQKPARLSVARNPFYE